MALSPAFLDELRARTPISVVIGRKVKLARSGRNMKGNCPFHNEKTPSFYVYDDGYHCFGCGAHGDAVSFVMQSQGLGFMEAVQQLAGEAGLEVPKASPEAAEVERRRLGLTDVLARAAEFFRTQLYLPEGKAGLDYLRKRGLSELTIARFGLGWSGEGRGALVAELGRDGIIPAQLLEAGLLRETESGELRELFFNRVMFPIRDRRGTAISFGGRILGDGQPKYVNGPETSLFSKRRNLYALDFARTASREGAVVTVVEGYMDVIALHQAGFTGAVAPLGTALTEEQLAEIWRISPAPVLCFDGDAAGGRAAARTAELVLPLLTPAHSLRLATLPAGEDPDSLVRGQGAAAFQAVLNAARPLSDVLFDLLRPASGTESPEQRAAFRVRLEEAAKRIPDRALASEYRTVLLDRFFAARRRGLAPGGRVPTRPMAPRGVPSDALTGAERGRILLAILLRHPALLRDVEHALEELALPEGLARVLHALLRWAEAADVLDSAGLMSHLTETGLTVELADILSATPVPLPTCAAPDAMPGEAEAGWWHFFGLLNRARLQEEVSAAGRYFAEHGDDRAAEQRLIALTRARETLNREQGEADIG
ncbi:MAG: DNA primase [Acetobacteraceae bacterium]|nr:DNA primase [Acetobacteraceae bacterium]